MTFSVAPRPSALVAEKISELVDEALVRVREAEPQRTYLGASLLGYACDRRLGYEYFKTAGGKGFTAKTYRLFDTGHDAEARVVEYLRHAGFEILTERPNKKGQFGFGLWPDDDHPKGRVAGHCDGIIVRTPVDLPVPGIWENKAMNNSRWNTVKRDGLKAAEPEYYVQIQLYMGNVREALSAGSATPNPSLWTAFNRDTGEIYYEIVEFDRYIYEKTMERAARIIQARGPEYLDRVTGDPSDFRCKWCPFKEACWAAPAVPRAPGFGAGQSQAPPAAPAWVFGRQ